MSRRRTKNFDMAEGVYYFKIKKGISSDIIIKRTDKASAIHAYKTYLTTQPGKTDWLGKYNGSNFDESNFDALLEAGSSK